MNIYWYILYFFLTKCCITLFLTMQVLTSSELGHDLKDIGSGRGHKSEYIPVHNYFGLFSMIIHYLVL